METRTDETLCSNIQGRKLRKTNPESLFNFEGPQAEPGRTPLRRDPEGSEPGEERESKGTPAGSQKDLHISGAKRKEPTVE